MALTAEQQAQLEFDSALAAQREQDNAAMYAREAADALKLRRVELLRLAREVLTESDRAKPVEDRGITAEQIVSFATVLENHVNS